MIFFGWLMIVFSRLHLYTGKFNLYTNKIVVYDLEFLNFTSRLEKIKVRHFGIDTK